jgi:multiple sugar transport system ATP-binding protein
MNLFEAALSVDGNSVMLGTQRIELTSEVTRSHPGLKHFVSKSVVVGIRPEDLHAASDERPGAVLVGKVELVEALGSELLVHFSTDASVVQPEISTRPQDSPASVDGVDSVLDCVARIEPRHDVRAGDNFKFSVSPDRLEFFDPSTGLSILE